VYIYVRVNHRPIRYQSRRNRNIYANQSTTRSICEKIYTDTVTEDKDYLVKDYEDMEYIDDNFEYSYRIDEYEDLLVIKKHPIDIVQDTEHHPSLVNG
jgi:hypothetical protein